MTYSKVPYLEWAHLKPTVEFNLSGSSVGITEPGQVNFCFEGIPFSGPNQYGYRPLLNAIAARYGMDPGNIATASGTSMANFLVCATLIQSGDEVIVERPCYGPMLNLPHALGARVKRIERRFENAFQIDVAELRRLANRKTRLILLTDLHNPSGVKIPRSTLEEIDEIARGCRAHVLVDEVYLDLCGEERPPSAAAISKRYISTNSLTKVYGLDGLRSGWILAEEKLIQRIWRVRDYVDANGAFPAEWIAARIFAKLDPILDKSRRMVRENFPLVRKFIEAQPDLSWVPPDGGVICFPRYKKPRELPRLLDRLLGEFDTLVVPGRFFESPAHVRLGFGSPRATLRSGLENFGKVLNAALRD